MNPNNSEEFQKMWAIWPEFQQIIDHCENDTKIVKLVYGLANTINMYATLLNARHNEISVLEAKLKEV